MVADKRNFNLWIPLDLAKKIEVEADKNKRTLNSQFEWIVENYYKNAKRRESRNLTKTG